MSRSRTSIRDLLESFAERHGGELHSAPLAPTLIEVPHRLWTIKISYWPGTRRSAPWLTLRVPFMPHRGRHLSLRIRRRSIFDPLASLFGSRALTLADPGLNEEFHVTNREPELVHRLFAETPIGRLIQSPLFHDLRLGPNVDASLGVQMPPSVQQLVAPILLRYARGLAGLLFNYPPICDQLEEALPHQLALGRALFDGLDEAGALQQRNPERFIRAIL